MVATRSKGEREFCSAPTSTGSVRSAHGCPMYQERCNFATLCRINSRSERVDAGSKARELPGDRVLVQQALGGCPMKFGLGQLKC
jgi:hypothetical protein